MKQVRPIDPPSATLLAIAERYLARFLGRQFGGLRVAVDGEAPVIQGPTVFYANHPGWWDPIVLLLLIRKQYRDWRFHGPIDQAALERYPVLERLGLFGLRADSAAGARRFFEIGDQLLETSQAGIAMTAQGRFADVRERPVALKRGLGRLLSRHPQANAWPVAIEYVFWNERLPEILVRFGSSPVAADGLSADVVHRRLESALEAEMDELAAQAKARDPALFRSLVTGRRGIGTLEDLPLRIRSLLRGKPFDPSHFSVGNDANSAR